MSQVYADRVTERVRRVTAIDPKAIARVLREELGLIRVAVDFKLVTQALMEVGVVRPATHSLSITLAPNQAVKHVLRVPRNHVYLLGQARFACDPDHALELYIYIDGDLVYWDGDMVQARYIHPLTMMEIGALVVLRDRGEFIVVNKSSSPAHFSYNVIFAYTTSETWSRIADAISDTVAKALNIPVVYRRTG
jgi:ribosomal protein S25